MLHLLLVFALAATQGSVHPADRLRLIDRQLVEDLLERDLGELLAKKQTARDNIDESIRRLNLCIRAGRRREAASVIDRLGELKIEADLTRSLLDFLIGRREIDLAVRLIERVPGSGREFQSIIVGYWITEARKPRDEVDRWVAARGWDDDRSRAHDIALDRSDPLTATEARDRGERAASANMWSLAVRLYERALAMPFTHEDMQREMRVLSMPPRLTDVEWERRFRSRTRLALAEAYRNAGDSSRAQGVLAEAAREDPSIVADRRFATMAGRAQRESGARAIEQEFRASEPANEHSREYWMARARYFAARKDQSSTVDAYERALTLARAEPANSRATRHALQTYNEFLVSIGDRAGAWRLLRQELELGSRREDDWIFDALARHLSDVDQLATDSGWIWATLELRADWEHATSVLEQLVREGPSEQRAAAVQRSLALVANADVRRMLPLARALTRAGEVAAAVPLFERALAEQSGSDRAAVTRELTSAKRAGLRRAFQHEIQRYDWRRAEQTWDALLRLESSPLDRAFDASSTAWAMVRLAEAAAHERAGEEALRFWRAAVNLDRAAGLELLPGFPLTRYRAELIALYEGMATRDPASWVPEAALAKLRQ